MKKRKYGYDELRKVLIILGVMAVVGYFVAYVMRHWDIIVTFWESRSQAELTAIMSQLRSKTVLNFIILILLTAATAAIPFMSNAIFAVFNGVVYGPGVGFLMNVVSNVFGNFVFIKILEKIDITDSKNKLQSRFGSIDLLEKTDFGIVLGYMIPIMPTILVNYYVTESKLSWRKWLLYVTIGVAPSSLVYALGGDAVVAGNFKRIAVLLVIIILVYLIVTYVKRKTKKQS